MTKDTVLALALMTFAVALALLSIYVGWKRTDLHDHMMGVFMGAIPLAAVLFMLPFFFQFPENRKPIAFFLLFMLLIAGPLAAVMPAQAYTAFRIEAFEERFQWTVLPYVLFVTFVFFRGGSWAMTADPVPGSKAISQASLQQQLLAITDDAKLPFTIKPGKRDGQLVVDWKYADATWFDLMRVHKISQLSRLVLDLDEQHHTVRAREYRAEFDASAGLGGAALSFKAKWGAITFYEIKRETVFGIQLENGRPTARLHYTYRFSIQEMREPLQKLATENGWTFKSVVLPIRWLTG